MILIWIMIWILSRLQKAKRIFNKWIVNYPFYANIHREGVVLYGAASAVENAVEVQVAIISKH